MQQTIIYKTATDELRKQRKQSTENANLINLENYLKLEFLIFLIESNC